MLMSSSNDTRRVRPERFTWALEDLVIEKSEGTPPIDKGSPARPGDNAPGDRPGTK